jgi:hypothetical protein
MTTATTRASGTTRVHPESASQMISLRLWIVPREARRQRRRRSLKSSCRRNAHGIQVPIMRQLIATTTGGHLAILVVARRTSQWTKNPKMTTKGTNRTTRSSRMPQRPSTSSSGEMETSAPSGTQNCFFGRSCPSSQRYHDHFVGRRSPYHFLTTTSGQASQCPVSSPWSWIRWWQKSGSPRCSSSLHRHAGSEQVSFLRRCPR